MNKNDSDFRQLKTFIFEGNYSEIDNWFKKMNLSKKDEDSLILRMLNETYLFSFSSSSTDRDFTKQEQLNREIAVLKNFAAENQLKLFNVTAIGELNHKHIEAMNLTNENKKLIKNSNNIIYAIADLLNNENFAELDKIFNVLQMNLLDNKVKGVIFHRNEDYSRGMNFFKIEEELFSAKFNIVSIYSDAKKDYILSKNIALPTIEEVKYLKAKIVEYINNSHVFRQQDIDKVNTAYDKYMIQKNYLDLNMELNNNNNSKDKKPKI